MSFFASYPKEKERRLCLGCYEESDHLNGVTITKYGIDAARICLNCDNIQYADKSNNPFTDINDKLDKLLSWAGLE